MSQYLELAAIIKEATLALRRLGDGIAHLAMLAVKGYDAYQSRSNRTVLEGLRHDLEKMYGGSSIPMLKSIETYIRTLREGEVSLLDRIKRGTPPAYTKGEDFNRWWDDNQQNREDAWAAQAIADGHWKILLLEIAQALRVSEGLISVVGQTKGDFVFSDAYSKISRALYGRGALLRGILDPDDYQDYIRPKVSDESIAQLELVAVEYRDLIQEIARCSDALSKFANQVKPEVNEQIGNDEK